MMKLVSFVLCPFAHRVAMALLLKDIEHEITFVDLKNKPEWFLEISPTGAVPILILDDGRVLFESTAICEYIDERFPHTPLFSQDVIQKAIERAVASLALPLYGVSNILKLQSKEEFEEKRTSFKKPLSNAEKLLEEKPYFRGKEFGMVDIYWLSPLFRFDLIKKITGLDLLEPYPKLKRWQENLLSKGLAQKAIAPQFMEDFKRMYVSPQSYLASRT